MPDDDKAVVPGRPNRRVKMEHDRAPDVQRNRIQRMFGPTINLTVTTRHDQLTDRFPGMVHLATAGCWLRFVHVTEPAADSVAVR